MYFFKVFCVFIIFLLNDKITVAIVIENNDSEVQGLDSKQNNRIEEDPVVLLISFDGFGNDCLMKNATPYLNQLRVENSYSEYMRSVFPTKTFTNHHSISTGMYAGQHGVLNNAVYDMKLQKLLKYSYELFHYNEEIVPIYTLNEQAGKHSACLMWPGSDFPYFNKTCTYTQSLNFSIQWNDKIDMAISWIKNKTKPASLVMAYFEEPDSHTHVVSPNNEMVTDMIRNVDKLVNYVQDSLVRENLQNRVNVIYVSDHGMDSYSAEYLIDITKILQNGTYEIYGVSPVLQVIPARGKEMEVMQSLRTASRKNGHFKVYSGNKLPGRWNCDNKQRVGPILLVADLNYVFQDANVWIHDYNKKYNIPLAPSTMYGSHGWDNTYPSMHSFFMATGPAFKKLNLVDPFDSVDLYNLIAHLLNLTPPANDGIIANINALLVDPIPLDETTESVIE